MTKLSFVNLQLIKHGLHRTLHINSHSCEDVLHPSAVISKIDMYIHITYSSFPCISLKIYIH